MFDLPLITIITPSFNCGNYISRLLESVLGQSYPNIEMFVCDDGSTDNTKEIVCSYEEKFSRRNYKLTYLYQKNSGQSVAINYLLKKVNGEYLVWPDADDFYSSSDAIKKMYDALKNTDDSVSMVQTDFYFVEDNTLKIKEQYKINDSKNWFEDCLLVKNNYQFCPGKYMAKMEILDRTIPKRNIYTEKDAGQNWQIMLPLLFKRKCLIINQPLYSVVERKSSHSRTKGKIEFKLSRIQTYENTILETLRTIPEISEEDREYFQNMVKEKYIDERFNIAVQTGNRKLINKFYFEKKNLGYVNKIDYLKKIFSLGFRFYNYIKRSTRFAVRKFRSFLCK
ncbi:glycosyltransferase family 2 protein [Treponema sp.]|uniref:glycosyltransferase family 2 protein n=1 Tax=Treponema sp. TaxID=166 RepID=UPI003FD73A38